MLFWPIGTQRQVGNWPPDCWTSSHTENHWGKPMTGLTEHVWEGKKFWMVNAWILGLMHSNGQYWDRDYLSWSLFLPVMDQTSITEDLSCVHSNQQNSDFWACAYCLLKLCVLLLYITPLCTAPSCILWSELCYGMHVVEVGGIWIQGYFSNEICAIGYISFKLWLLYCLKVTWGKTDYINCSIFCACHV